MGYKNSLLTLFNDIDKSLNNKNFILDLENENWHSGNSGGPNDDQTIISHHLSKYWNKYNIKLDYHCKIFYIPCKDWNNINQHVSYDLKLINKNTTPSIIHVPWKRKYKFILDDLFHRKYNTILNKKYIWDTNNKIQANKIEFCKDSIVKTNFSKNGAYIYKSKYLVESNFGGRSHILKFNANYTKFISIRKGDFELINGIICS